MSVTHRIKVTHSSLYVIYDTVLPFIYFMSINIKHLEKHVEFIFAVSDGNTVTWKFTMNPPEHYRENDQDLGAWDEIGVPGEAAMQGFPIQPDPD
jgi:hypothetical protein